MSKQILFTLLLLRLQDEKVMNNCLGRDSVLQNTHSIRDFIIAVVQH